MTLRKIGLIGGMSFEGSSVYYRKINETISQKLGELHSARILLESLDFQDIVALQRSNRWNDAGLALAEAEIASEIYSIAGDYDILAKFYLTPDTDIGHFVGERVQPIPGIVDTKTIITFKAF